MQRPVCLAIIFLLVSTTGFSQEKMVKILVSTPYVENKVFQPVGDVMCGTIIREFKRAGGMEILERNESEQRLKAHGLDERIGTRYSALEAGEVLGVDIVIFSIITRNYDFFRYSIIFLEIERDVVQRTINGTFKVSDPPSEIGKIMKEKTQELIKYVPLPSELNDPGSLIRQVTVNPQQIPQSAEIEDIPPIGRYGNIEQIFNYYRVFPGELEYSKFENQRLITRLELREDLDSELTGIINNFYIYADFALRHNLQAFFIENCSIPAMNLLLANNIPVFYADGILVEYSELSQGGFCVFKTIENQPVYSSDITHRKRMAVMFIVPKPGRRMGISREFLERSISYFKNEQGETPRLVAAKESMLDIGGSTLE